MTEHKPSSTGLPAHVAALLCYVFGFVSGAVFLAIEKDSEFVRFHAMQSLVLFLGLLVIGFGAAFVPVFGWMVSLMIAPVQFIFWVVLMYKAFSGQRWKAPVAGDIAETQLAKHFPTPLA